MKRIKVYFEGGLGNQLFQYTAGMKLHQSFPEFSINFTSRHLRWSNTSVNIDYFLKIPEIKCISNKYFFAYMSLKDSLFGYNIRDNSSSLINFEDIPRKSYYILKGFFQNPSWYRSVVYDVCDEICLHSKEKIFDKFDDSELVLHFRRSDYVKLGWEIDLKYYYDALKVLNNNKEKQITIVSDDSQFSVLISDKLKTLGYKISPFNTKFIFPESVNAFATIIKSKNLVIANSSFSWWAASVRNIMGYNNKQVICPKNWFPKNKNFHPGKHPEWTEINNLFI